MHIKRKECIMSDNKNEELFSVDLHNKIYAQRFEAMVKRNCQAVFNDPSKSSIIPPMMCWGSPGCGKTSIVYKVAKDLGVDLIDVRLAQMEPCDIKGLPVADHEHKKMNWYVNGAWPDEKTSPKGILFLDELSACDRSIAVAAYQLILERKLGELYKLPAGWYIVAAGNMTTDRAVATTMPSALANRFMHVELATDAEQWVEWALKNNIDGSVVGYIQYKPSSLFNMKNENLERGWPTPRSWERVSEMVKMYNDDVDILRTAVYGLVGTAKGVEFMSFYNLTAKFNNVLDMMVGKIPVSIPSKKDELYAFCSAMNYLLWHGKNAGDQEARVNGFLEILNKLSEDFSCMCMTTALVGTENVNKVAAAKMLTLSKGKPREQYVNWQKKIGTNVKKHLIIK